MRARLPLMPSQKWHRTQRRGGQCAKKRQQMLVLLERVWKLQCKGGKQEWFMWSWLGKRLVWQHSGLRPKQAGGAPGALHQLVRLCSTVLM